MDILLSFPPENRLYILHGPPALCYDVAIINAKEVKGCAIFLAESN